ncbi:MAG: hypothetical protein C4K48_11630 [Candidatus Thorarchaeota archaeon]|nr:MAG: hypothetical protein C4K48_11630 [Candidatus Thorarchaeota archaeon]
MIKAQPVDIQSQEVTALQNLRKIAWDIDSPNMGIMYDAVGRLASISAGRLLLPKALELLNSKDRNIKQAAFTVAGKNAYGKYLDEFFAALNDLNPAEREQTLQGIQEMFSQTGGPTSNHEQKNWIKNLEGLGREHQPAIFELMIHLGTLGKTWIIRQIRDNIRGISLGAVPTLSMFPESEKKSMISLLSSRAAKERRDLLPYICGIVDHQTQSHLQVFMRKSTWQERADIAVAVAALGIKSSSGLVMELVADTKWQVKQALLENARIESSRVSALFTVLSHLLAESHTRVRAQAERTLLQLGNVACEDVTIKEQRKKLEKRFRTQLLKAAQANKDIEVKWLGIERKQMDPMSEIMERISPDVEDTDLIAAAVTPEGVSLADFAVEKPSAVEDEEKASLLSALLGARNNAVAETKIMKVEEPLLLDPTIPAASRFILVMQKVAEDVGKDVPITLLSTKCSEAGLTKEDFEKALNELEQQGIVYRSSKGSVSYVDIEL